MNLFSSQLQTLKALLDWRVSLDIIIIALIIFFLYHTLRSTGVGKILLGILLAAAVFFLARILDLRGIDWIYSNLSQVFLLGLIILFQPELRKIFERAASLRPRESIRETSKISYILSDVAFALSRQKRGALFVIPGKDSIRPLTSEGISVEAKVSFPLLMSIFDPNSPGHDGAAIVEYGKLNAFGVRLPLSKTSNLSEDFGTRHHAAMSLSEVTDAFLIAVSEERGAVTMFRNGQASVTDDQNALASHIIEHLESSGSYELPGFSGRRRKVLLLEFVVSLVLAFIFWSTVVLTQN